MKEPLDDSAPSEKDHGEFALLMQSVREGSQEAARTLFERYGPHIRRVVRRKLHQKLRPQFDSVDFVQDVWASFFAQQGRQASFESRDLNTLPHVPEWLHLLQIAAFLGRFETTRKTRNQFP